MSPASIALPGDGLDLDPRALWEGSDADRRARRWRIRHEPPIDRVDRGEIGHVDEEDRGLEHVSPDAAGGVQHGRQAGHHSLRFGLDTAFDELAGRWVQGRLTGREEQAIAGDALAVRPDGG